jgi:hypothetical protein
MNHDEPVATDLPAFRAWSTQFVPPMKPSGYVTHEIPLLSAMLVVELVFPRLIDVRGCILRADRYDEANFDDWWTSTEGNSDQIERILNYFPTLMYFEPTDEVEERALEVLADRIALGWRAQAAIQFPNRPIVVRVIEGTEDDGPSVMMYTDRSGSNRSGPAT